MSTGESWRQAGNLSDSNRQVYQLAATTRLFVSEQLFAPGIAGQVVEQEMADQLAGGLPLPVGNAFQRLHLPAGQEQRDLDHVLFLAACHRIDLSELMDSPGAHGRTAL